MKLTITTNDDFNVEERCTSQNFKIVHTRLNFFCSFLIFRSDIFDNFRSNSWNVMDTDSSICWLYTEGPYVCGPRIVDTE